MIKYLEHIERYVVKIKSGYLTWCAHLRIYVLSSADNAQTFKTKDMAQDALKNYKKFK